MGWAGPSCRGASQELLGRGTPPDGAPNRSEPRSLVLACVPLRPSANIDGHLFASPLSRLFAAWQELNICPNAPNGDAYKAHLYLVQGTGRFARVEQLLGIRLSDYDSLQFPRYKHTHGMCRHTLPRPCTTTQLAPTHARRLPRPCVNNSQSV